MTLDDLRTSMQNFMPTWVNIEENKDGEIVIYTGLKVDDSDDTGDLVEIDD
jgi:hypothetical protein